MTAPRRGPTIASVLTDELPANWVVMRLRGLILDPNSDAPVVILREADEGIFLPIWIGPFEASAIAMAAEGVEPPRPMTHDLLCSVLQNLGAKLVRIEIFALLEGTFHARLIVESREGERREVDSRPSDALALALRVDAPIWTAREVLDSALKTSRAAASTDEEKLREWLAQASSEDLGKYSM